MYKLVLVLQFTAFATFPFYAIILFIHVYLIPTLTYNQNRSNVKL